MITRTAGGGICAGLVRPASWLSYDCAALAWA
jgi:hypothetical protein